MEFKIDSFVSKLRNTVSNTVFSVTEAVSTALPGNPVTREYEILSLVASGGPCLVWKIYNAIKKSTRQEAAVFVFEKKILERFPKRDREAICEQLRKGVAQLTKLRHPCILTVQHSLEESRDSLAFATEPVSYLKIR